MDDVLQSDLSCCGNCLYWERWRDTKRNTHQLKGECRRHAPFGYYDAAKSIPCTRWPMTFEDAWCGDYEDVEKEEADG